MEDGIAREGVLTRCNQNRDATLTDEECANARRAAAAVALEAERAREPELARESEAKLLALRQREARRAASEQDTAAAALAAAEAAYEARWRNSPGNRSADDSASSAPVAAFGVPVGPVMPSMTESSLFDVYADGSDPLGRRSLEVAAAEPPANDLSIQSPDLELAELAIVPRPFRDRRRHGATLTPQLCRYCSRGNVTASSPSPLGAGELLFGATDDGVPGSTAAVRNASRNGSAAAGVSKLCAPSGTPLVLR